MWRLPCHLLHKQVLLGSGFFKSQLPVQNLGQEGLVYWVGHFVFTVAAKEAETEGIWHSQLYGGRWALPRTGGFPNTVWRDEQCQ